MALVVDLLSYSAAVTGVFGLLVLALLARAVHVHRRRRREPSGSGADGEDQTP